MGMSEDRLELRRGGTADHTDAGLTHPGGHHPALQGDGAAVTDDPARAVAPASPLAPVAAGLTAEQVAARTAAGQVNLAPAAGGRSVAQIVRANVFTRFNAILGTLFVVVLIVGPLQDGLFGAVLVVNTGVGVIQELRAKRTLERLAVLTAPRARLVRDGSPTEVAAEAVVLGDHLLLAPGDQVVADGTVAAADGLELDESLVSGESLPVKKAVGEPVLSGSVVVAGSGAVQVTAVGADAFAQRLEGEGRRFSLVRSELQQGINQILRLVTWIMIPSAILLVTSQMLRADEGFIEAVRVTGAGIGTLVPEGLVLLTTLAFALGGLRLARRRVLVQELAAIEGLARVDVLCVDKTGTLTDPAMELVDVVAVGRPAAEVRKALGALAAADPAPNTTMAALGDLPAPEDWRLVGAVAFSSARKWSAAAFEGQGTWVLGAPEFVMTELSPTEAEEVARPAALGHRVLLLAWTAAPLAGEVLPAGLACAGLAVLEEQLRPGAGETIKFLLGQDVAVKVVSGDNPLTVGAVARRVGIDGGDRPLDARQLPADGPALAETVERATVLGRVQPNQKRDIVLALQSQGHVVAMTGDGVNDIPALKAADLGMAMGSGSPATRAVGKVVLLDNSFAVVPQLLDEGRRVIANVERVANLFVTKTVYSALLAIAVGIIAIPYPFYHRHLTLVSGLTIGLPALAMAFAPGAPRARPGFVSRLLWFAVPAGTVVAGATLTADLVASGPYHADHIQTRTVATFTLLALGLVVLALAARPLRPVRALLVLAMVGGAVLAWVVPLSRRVFTLVAPPQDAVVAAVVVVAIAAPVLVVVVLAAVRRRART